MEAGSWTELAVGVGTVSVAVTLGLMALAESRKATRWARRVAELQVQANELTELGLLIAFSVSLDVVIHEETEETGTVFDSWLVLTCAPGSSAPFVHGMETIGALFGSVAGGNINLGDLFNREAIEPNPDEELPKQLHAGDSIAFANPWRSFSAQTSVGNWARVKVSFSAGRGVVRSGAGDCRLAPAGDRSSRLTCP